MSGETGQQGHDLSAGLWTGFRYLQLRIVAFLSSPLHQKRRRRRLIELLLAEPPQSEACINTRLTRANKRAWKLTALRRFPISAAKRRAWRARNPFLSQASGGAVSSLSPVGYLNARWFGPTPPKPRPDQPSALPLPPRPASLGRAGDVTLIAHYVAQIPVPEIEAWQGVGQTVWHRTARTFPVFPGHAQPRHPADLGRYDPASPQTLSQQVALARSYGIDAFSFQVRWSGGQSRFDAPLRNVLADKTLDMAFCLGWANGPVVYSRTGEVLFDQSYAPDDDADFLRYAAAAFQDPRYLRVDGRPVLTVYRPALLPDARATVARWRQVAQDMGLPGLYLIATDADGFADHLASGFDALSEWPALDVPAPGPAPRPETSPVWTGSHLVHYDDLVAARIDGPIPEGRVHPGVLTGWDDSPLDPTRGAIVHGTTPERFRHWLAAAIRRARRNPWQERLVFISAWNDWVHGSYLEPDRQNGAAYVAACRAALVEDRYGLDPRATELPGRRIPNPDRKTVLVCSHTAGPELFGGERSMLDAVRAIAANGFDVVVTLPDQVPQDYLDALLDHAVQVRIFPCPQWTPDPVGTLAALPWFIAAIRDCAIDLVYVNTIVLRAPLEAARLCGKPAIIHVREIIASDAELQQQIGRSGPDIARIVARSCSAIVANSAATATNYPPLVPIDTIPNIVDVAMFDIPNRTEGDTMTFGIISSNLPKKGIEDVIQLARLCETDVPAARFAIIGSFHRAGVADYVNGRREAPTNVRFIDYTSSPVEALSHVNVILNFSHFQESFGRTVLEAMAAGRPALVYDWGALPELVEDGVSGFVIPYRQPGAAVEAVRSLTNPHLLARMGEAARLRAIRLADVAGYTKRIGAVLSRTFAQQPARTPFATVAAAGLSPEAGAEIDVVVCIHNALDDVRTCLAELDRHRGPRLRVVLVDDGSGPETRDFLIDHAAARAHVTLHRNEVALGYTKAVNIGIRLTRAPTIILLNSDTIVTHGWAEKLADALWRAPGAGIAGPMSNAATHQSLPEADATAGRVPVNDLPEGWVPEQMNAFCEATATLPYPFVPLVHGFCFALRREVWDEVGPFDETAFPFGYGEENDFCLRATDAGWGLVVATSTYVFHAKSKSYGPAKRDELVQAGQRVMVERHGEVRFHVLTKVLEHDPDLEDMREKALALYAAGT